MVNLWTEELGPNWLEAMSTPSTKVEYPTLNLAGLTFVKLKLNKSYQNPSALLSGKLFKFKFLTMRETWIT